MNHIGSRTILPLLFLTLVLGACSLRVPTVETISTVPTNPWSAEQGVIPVTDVGCGYQWANQDLPELSAKFDRAVKALIPEASSRAAAFGENCHGANGQIIKFLAMETDFYVTATVQALDDHETFGNWAAGVMQIVIDLPADQLMGSKPGFVEFRFEKGPLEFIVFRIPIQQYKDTANGITGEELFRMFLLQP